MVMIGQSLWQMVVESGLLGECICFGRIASHYSSIGHLLDTNTFLKNKSTTIKSIWVQESNKKLSKQNQMFMMRLAYLEEFQNVVLGNVQLLYQITWASWK